MAHTGRMPDVAIPEPGPYTWEDFIALDEDDLRELIDGELVEVEVPTKAHERIGVLITYFLEAWADPRDAGMTLGAGYKIRVTDKRGVDPAQRTVERLVLDRGRYAIADALEGDVVFRPASFEGLEIPLAKLWKVLDDP